MPTRRKWGHRVRLSVPRLDAPLARRVARHLPELTKAVFPSPNAQVTMLVIPGSTPISIAEASTLASLHSHEELSFRCRDPQSHSEVVEGRMTFLWIETPFPSVRILQSNRAFLVSTALTLKCFRHNASWFSGRPSPLIGSRSPMLSSFIKVMDEIGT